VGRVAPAGGRGAGSGGWVRSHGEAIHARTIGPVTDPRPAATVVLLRPGPKGLEALLTHRPTTMEFAPDVHVFPGGRLDPADADPGLQARSVISADEAEDALDGDLSAKAALAHYVAAIREAFEEVGILLADVGRAGDLVAARRRLLESAQAFPQVAEDLDLRLRTDLLVPLSHWVTPPFMNRRFDARFFVAASPDAAEVTLVGEEVATHAWYRPVDALESMAAGELDMWLPTSTTLTQLVHATSIDEIRDRLAPGRLGTVEVETIAEEIVRIEMPAGGGVAGQPINAYLVGRQQFMLIDPGDPTGEALDVAVAEAKRSGGSIVAVALTHADPDHAAGGEALREGLGVEVIVGPGGGRYLPYLVREVTSGTLIEDGDVPIRVVGTPGPAPEHLAFVIGEGRFAVTGDLDGRRGARSILGTPDERAWQWSMADLASVAPEAVWLDGHPSLDSGA
jgi:glyoxylase-like metal-dependent hydrolase (beta-lactamase superfamily II)/8-oxo-dGTP pyrophosphatase MutT (NUDIX family)